MDPNQRHTYSVLADSVSVDKSRLGMPSFTPGMYHSIPRRKSTINKVNDVCFNGWIDSMRASSPPHRNLNVDSEGNSLFDEDGSAYLSWTLRHPSALESFEQITNLAKGKHIALFLDYDGTLSPIVNDPNRAFMSGVMRAAVRHAAKYFHTAIISGRSCDKVFQFVGLTEVYYAGSHGMDIMGPVGNSESVDGRPNCVSAVDMQGKEVHLFQPASKFIPMIKKVFISLLKSTKGIRGVIIENNKFCVSVHYRLVDEKVWPVVAQIVHDTLKSYPDLRVSHGRKVLEIRPVIDWNKGKAVEFLLQSLGLGDSADVLPMFIGDDQTDEDAFKVLRERNLGFGILVSSVPKETSAFYSLKDTAEVLNFLEFLVKWKKKACTRKNFNQE